MTWAFFFLSLGDATDQANTIGVSLFYSKDCESNRTYFVWFSYSLSYVFPLTQGIRLINKPNKDDLAPLHVSINCGHTPVTEVLLSHGADINLQTGLGETCLHLAALSSNDPAYRIEMRRAISEVQFLTHLQITSICKPEIRLRAK